MLKKSSTTTQNTDTARKGSLWARLVVLASGWAILALLFGGYILSLTFRQTVEQNLDTRLDGLLENLIGISDFDAQGVVSLYRVLSDPRFEQPYSGWYWQISAKDYEPFRSRSLWDQTLETNLEIPHTTSFYGHVTGPEEQKLRIVERDVTPEGSDITFRYTIAIDTLAIEQQVARFDRVLFWSLGALGVGLIMAILVIVVLGLRPLRHIRRSLSSIRNGTSERLEGDFPSEIQPLANEMNALLDHNDEIIDRSRTQVGNLAHALKTPLAILLNEADLNKDSFSEVVTKQSQTMRRHVDHYLRRARVAANVKVISSRTPVEQVIRDLCRAMSIIHPDKKVIFEPSDEISELSFRGEKQDLEEMVGNLVENAAKWAHENVKVGCEGRDEQIIITIADDGPGIDPAVRESVFKRGERLDENQPGSGLGLSIVRDLVQLYGGEIRLEDHQEGAENKGLSAILILPAV